YATAQELAVALDRFLGGYPDGDCSWLKRLLYLIRRHRTLTGAVCAGLLLAASGLGLSLSARWQQQLNDARREFDIGREQAATGQISAGYARMRDAVGRLPFYETLWRGYFNRSLAAWGSSLNREVARLAHPSEILAAAASPDGRYVLLG